MASQLRAKGTGRPRLVNDKLLIEALTLKEARHDA